MHYRYTIPEICASDTRTSVEWLGCFRFLNFLCLSHITDILFTSLLSTLQSASYSARETVGWLTLKCSRKLYFHIPRVFGKQNLHGMSELVDGFETEAVVAVAILKLIFIGQEEFSRSTCHESRYHLM